MWLPKGNGMRKNSGNGLVAVAIDKDKGSQNAFKWALDNLLSKGQTVVLVHVLHKSTGTDVSCSSKMQMEKFTKELFLSFRCYCTRKDVHCIDIVLEDQDTAKALTEYVSQAAIENLVLGSSSRGFMRKFKADIPTYVSKGAPDFTSVYVVTKGKVTSLRNATRPAPYISPLLNQMQSPKRNSNVNDELSDTQSRHNMSINMRDKSFVKPRVSVDESFRSPFGRGGRGYNYKAFADVLDSENDISFVSSGRPSTDRSSYAYDFSDSAPPSRISTSSETSFGSVRGGNKLLDLSSLQECSPFSPDSARTSVSGSSSIDDVETEVKRLRLELKQTMDLYSTACKEALAAKQKTMELNRWRAEEERRFEEAKTSEEAAISLAEKERAKCRAAMEAVEAAKKKADLEAKLKQTAEMRGPKEADEMKKVMDTLSHNDIWYRRYSIEEIELATQCFAESRKIGEGGYGPVFKCRLDHTPVAVKVLRPDAAQGRSQFQREIEVLSLIRHPHMVLLLGACPEYGILVYEYMARGSLDDCLFHKGKVPALSWPIRFRIAAEIATGLLFLHQTKPEPLVHRDLKPGNILLDANYISKISDVGLAKLVPAVAENVTQYHMTTTAGTFCYIDPEYQQTGMLGVKSDIYSFGIILLQLLTAKSPMGLSHIVEQAIENNRFEEILDQDVPDWPIEEALQFAKLALQCAELRRKDRPDLRNVVLPELTKLREFAEEKLDHMVFAGSAVPASIHSYASVQEVISDPREANSVSSKSQSSVSSSQAEEQEAVMRMLSLMKGDGYAMYYR